MIRWIKIKKMNFPIHRPAPAGKNILSHFDSFNALPVSTGLAIIGTMVM